MQAAEDSSKADRSAQILCILASRASSASRAVAALDTSIAGCADLLDREANLTFQY